MHGPVGAALSRFRDLETGWTALPFFAERQADRLAAVLDRRIAEGEAVVPAPDDIFAGLALTPLASVSAVILGQDPYPTPGDAHGLAFSYSGARRLPASLRIVLDEVAADLGIPRPRSGDLRPWARQGVLLLNTALTCTAGQAGAHLALGWSALCDEVLAAVSARRPAVAFLLWGAPARRRAILVDRDKHLVLESGHPSPLNRARDFPGSRPFSRANAWLEAQGVAPIDWRLDDLS